MLIAALQPHLQKYVKNEEINECIYYSKHTISRTYCRMACFSIGYLIPRQVDYYSTCQGRCLCYCVSGPFLCLPSS